MVVLSEGILIETDIPTKVFIKHVDAELRDQGRGSGENGKGSLIVDDLDETHLVVKAELIEPLKMRLAERNRENTFDRD